MYQRIDAETFIFASLDSYDFLTVDKNEIKSQAAKMKHQRKRRKFIPKLLIQLNMAKLNNEEAMKEAEEPKEVADVGVMYLEGKRIQQEITNITNELNQLQLEYGSISNQAPTRLLKVHPKLQLKLGYNHIGGEMYLLLKKDSVNAAHVFS